MQKNWKPIMIYLALWLCVLGITYFGGLQGLNVLIYGLPVVSVAVSVMIGCDDSWQTQRWYFPPVFGVMYLLAFYIIFEAADGFMFASRVSLGQLALRGFLTGAVSSAAGMLLSNTIINTRPNRL